MNNDIANPMMIGPSFSSGGGDGDRGDDVDFENINRAALLAWEERQRRQRTLRTLMMILMFLLLMDGEEPPDRRNARLRQQRLRVQNNSNRNGGDSYVMAMYFDEDGNDLTPLNEMVYQRRREQDEVIRKAVVDNTSSRHHLLVKLNRGRDFEAELMKSVKEKMQEEMTVAATASISSSSSNSGAGGKEGDTTDTSITGSADASASSSAANNADDYDNKQQLLQQPNDELQVYHYPRNATGYYRGLWQRIPKQFNITTDQDAVSSSSIDEIYPWVKNELARRKLDACVLVLPPNVNLKVKRDGAENSTMPDDGNDNADAANTNKNYGKKSSITLTKESGRVAIQLYSHPIPAMNEISLVDGLVKLFDGTSSGFSSRQTDVLLRVRGVMIHSIGKMSLVTTFPSDDRLEDGSQKRSVFVVRQVGNFKSISPVPKSQVEVIPTEKDAGGATDEEDGEGSLVDVDEIIHDGEHEDDDETEVERHRRLQDTVDEILSQHENMLLYHDNNPKSVLEMVAQLREDVMNLYSFHYDHDILLDQHDDIISTTSVREKMESAGWTHLFQTIDEDSIMGQHNNEGPVDNNNPSRRRLQPIDIAESIDSALNENNTFVESMVNIIDSIEKFSSNNQGYVDEAKIAATTQRVLALSATPQVSVAEKHTYRFPYTIDDMFRSVERAAEPVLNQKLPVRDQFLEDNAGACEYNMNFNVQTTTWTYGDWRKTMDHRLRMEEAFNPQTLMKASQSNAELLKRLKKDPHFILVNKQVQLLEDDIPQESLVVTLSGNIESTNCDFASHVNATAMRTNWEKTTAKAINYSFYMMIACLTQIVVLLRQLLHTQAHSVACNVSLLCIGWQTVLDAMLCISHIFLCLVLQPLFTAFASVAFFKLLIFCVIEMKYMAIIIQARNSVNNTGTTQEQLRHQITVLHMKFYLALMLVIMLFWYVGQSYKTMYIMALYSFWMPQICWNIYSEYKKPMHPHYIYGMSFTRAVAPLYVFAVKNNFLKEVNPEFPTDPAMCEMLIVWIFLQAAILMCQSKFGTRFMIPQRFLPPKFDYSRPIPASLLPRPSSSSSNESRTSDIEFDPTAVGGGTRNRRGGGSNRGLADGTESMSEVTGEECTLDCVICYNEIDVTDKKGYMLAPCDHIFHRECLEQWMDVKMECPICRTNLPAL